MVDPLMHSVQHSAQRARARRAGRSICGSQSQKRTTRCLRGAWPLRQPHARCAKPQAARHTAHGIATAPDADSSFLHRCFACLEGSQPSATSRDQLAPSISSNSHRPSMAAGSKPVALGGGRFNVQSQLYVDSASNSNPIPIIDKNAYYVHCPLNQAQKTLQK